jgi:hypothetical protein
LVISEIMYHPPLSGTGFLELYNLSGVYAFDLGGMRVNGAGFTFQRIFHFLIEA